MKLFYDETGNAVGSFEGALPEIEAAVGLPSNATAEIVVPNELARRFNDPQDPAHPLNYSVVDGEIVPTSGTDQS